MPISDEVLQKEKNRFIAVKSEAKLGQAIAALDALGGQPWWHLVVHVEDGSWRAARFSAIATSIAATTTPEETCVGDIDLKAVPAVERNSIDTKAAQAFARQSPAHVLVVTENEIPIGILVEGTMRGGAAPNQNSGGLVVPAASINQLGGKYVKLKDYGSILLGSSKK